MSIDKTLQNIWKNFNDNFWDKTDITLLPSYQDLPPEELLEQSITRENYLGVVKSLEGEIGKKELCLQIERVITNKDDKDEKIIKILNELLSKHKKEGIDPRTIELLGQCVRHRKPNFFQTMEEELGQRGVREADFGRNIRYLNFNEKDQEEMFHLAVNSKFFKKEWFEGVIESACLGNEVKPINACVQYGADVAVGNCHMFLEILDTQLMKHSPDYEPNPISMVTGLRKTNKDDTIKCLQGLLEGYTIENLKTALSDKNLKFQEETKKFIEAELKQRVKKHIKDKIEEDREEEITV
jgi:hypothetical protein